MISSLSHYIGNFNRSLVFSAIMICAITVAQSGEYRLTEEQFLLSVEIQANNGIPWAIYRAFPAQKKSELLANFQTSISSGDYKFEANYLRALSFLINEADFEVIHKMYLERIVENKNGLRTVVGMSSDQVRSLGNLLGNCLLRLNSSKCEELVWKILESNKNSNDWYDKEVLLKNNKNNELGLAYKVVLIEGLAAFIDFSLTDPSNRLSAFAERMGKFIRDNHSKFGSLSWRLSQDALANSLKSRFLSEGAGITADDYNAILKRSTSNSVPRKVTTDRLAEDRLLAMKSYSLVSGAFLSRSFSSESYGYMLDNVKPFAKLGAIDEREQRRLDEFAKNEKEIDREAQIIKEVGNLLPGALDLPRHSDISINTYSAMPSGGYAVNLTSERAIIIPINGSQEIAKKFNLSGSSKSLSSDGRLQLYFLYLEGRWMWLPYGW